MVRRAMRHRRGRSGRLLPAHPTRCPGLSSESPPMPSVDPELCRTESAAPAPRVALDDVDRRLLRILQVDGRITNLKLAGLVGLSSASTHERVRRLVRDGTICGFSARLNPRLLRAGLLVFAEV